ncbi:hypothetical protein ACIQFZ_43470 [Streptomyces sp. NPDC093064]|uniref:hypothetical protein n=1 Tax=Streptomyces sp. NPDC093064 TaxID=3366020 RepID=UPI0037FFA4C0
MAALDAPAAAASTIFARSTARTCPRVEPARLVSRARNASSSTTDTACLFPPMTGDHGAAQSLPGKMGDVPKNPPESMQHHLRVRLRDHARERWPQLSGVQVRFRTGFAYVAGETPGTEEPLPLCRLRFTGVLHTWGFAIYLASSGKYQDNFLPTGLPFGSPEEALDCACGLYLNDPTAWTTPPSTN